jgi:tetratricopeptide (TPR) repeat protein
LRRRLGISRAAVILGFFYAAHTFHAAADTKAAVKAPASAQSGSETRLGDYLAGRAAQLDHDWKNAGPLIRRAWEVDREDATLRHDALLLSITGGDFAGAVEIAHAVPADSSDAALSSLILTIDDFTDGRYAAAEARIDAVPAHGLDRYASPLLTAWCEVGRGRKAEALAALAKLDSLDGVAELRALQSAMIMEALGDKAQAESFYGKLLEAKPSPWAVTMAAEFYERQGETDKAREVIERLDADGGSSSLRSELLAHLAARLRAPAPDPKFGVAEMLFEISASLESQQQQPDIAALLYLRLSLHVRPSFSSALILSARFDERWGHMDDAVASLLAVDEKSELRPMAEQLAMAALNKAGQADRAIKLGQTAVKAFPEDGDLLLAYAEILRTDEHYPDAIAAYDAALARVSPTSVRRGLILFHRGIAFQQSHQWPRAEADLLAALQLRPDDPALLNYLAFSWADLGINLDRARTMLERAIQMAPDDGAFVDSLGWVMYRSGDYDDAVTQLEHAVALDTGDAEINDHLGDAYWRVGRLIEARSQWEKAARLSDDKELTEKIRAKLKDGLDPNATPRHASAD